jgi:hypothetical protein
LKPLLVRRTAILGCKRRRRIKKGRVVLLYSKLAVGVFYPDERSPTTTAPMVVVMMAWVGS